MKPATALPWVAANDHPTCPAIFYVQAPGEHFAKEVAVLYTQDSSADAAYIVHACNAYPRLVEALRKVALAESLDDGVLAAFDGKGLLRELGELE